MAATGNIVEAGNVLCFGTATPMALEAAHEESLLREFFTWNGRENLYRIPDHFVLWLSNHSTPADLPHGPRNLVDWKKFWNSPETGSIEGTARHQGGDLLAKLITAQDKITPDDFRLRPDSAGYRAGPDGKDLGADIDLVGPGKAYERWKRTPEYQQWQRETRELMKGTAEDRGDGRAATEAKTTGESPTANGE